MKKLYDLAVKTGSYQTKDGNEKTTWLNVGAVWDGNDDTKFMLLKAAFNPAAIERKNGSDSISIAMFEPREEQRDKRSDDVNHNENDDSENDSDEQPIPF